MRVQQQPAYVLLGRPFSESSLICELFTKSHGRQAVLAKGARRQKSAFRGLLLPFTPLSVSWSGKNELTTLTAVETEPNLFFGWQSELRGRALICGFYCNELLASVLQRGDPHLKLFDAYHGTIAALAMCAEQSDTEGRLFEILRGFELALIRESGYGIDLSLDAASQHPIESNQWYQYIAGRGFVPAAAQHAGQDLVFSGRVLQALNQRQHQHTPLEERHQAKRLVRIILAEIVGAKRIVSRDLFYPTG